MNKKLLAIALFTVGAIALKSQTIVIDSVSIGSANESWYKLSTGAQPTQARANWDLGFTTDGYDVTVLFNHAVGNSVYIATGASPATFTAVTQADTSAAPLYNSDSTLAMGALNQQPSGSYNYGWGSYNTTTHNITGTRVFIVKFSNHTFKKFYIQDLNNSAVPYFYTLVYANIDNTGQQTVTIPKQTYGTKNFIYYSFTTNGIVDREPATADWDLLFTKYTSTTELYMGTPNQVVAGVTQNKHVLAAQANSVTASTYTAYTANTFSTTANILGWDWKGLNASFQYTVDPNRVYFVQDQNSDIYKIVFISYTGGSTGKFKFSKQKLSTTPSTSINENGAVLATIALYPNPVSNENATLLFSTLQHVSTISVAVSDITGKLIYTEQLPSSVGLQQHSLNTAALNAGIYFITLDIDGYRTTQKLIKQ